ncbi:hypothetical protein SAMN05428970_2322 [Agromyces sp. CF514]|uniref:hypothetical protein n=1 Tax=Agromyces sp. CF514 TaxID=1881031 RepID=UPI0008ED27F8|nr:hypothetical protein [Agromyces sp. CF514]SFR78065.1 hypothetical protein SAMN05428970_2322 [Agromyces sp. CF514]
MSGWLMRGRAGRDEGRADVDADPLATVGSGVAGYRIIRRIGSGGRAEVFLATLRQAETSTHDRGPADIGHPDAPSATPVESPLVVVRIYRDEVDDRSIACELDAMHAAPESGMPALFDVATSAAGERVAVVERIGGVGVAQLIHDRRLEPGEAVTLVAPVVAGVARLAAAGFVHTRLSPGDVLLDATGRPRLLGLGALRRLPSDDPAAAYAFRRDGLAALTDYIDQVVAAVRPAGVFDGALRLARASLEARPFVPFEAELERALFAAASPAPVAGLPPVREARLPTRMLAPLRSDPAAPEPAPRVGVRSAARSGVAGSMIELAELPPTVLEQLAESADTDRIGEVRRRASRWFSARRRPLVVAALVGAAALVLLLTAVPSDEAGGVGGGAAGEPDPGSASAGVPSDDGALLEEPAAAAAGDSAEDPAPDDTGTRDALDGAAGDDPVLAARGLLEAREACFADLDPACLATYVQAGSPLEDADWNLMLAARDGGSGIRALDLDRIEVVTEMGAAVLVRVAGPADAEPASLLMVRNEAGWRLREIFD